MIIIGLDLGTTTVSAVAIDGNSGVELASRTIQGKANLPSDIPGGRLQDPDAIVEKALAAVDDLKRSFGPVRAIGIDGQMHGVLYVDKSGRAVSPLYTWQDERAARPLGSGTYLDALEAATGQRLSTGFGLATHYWLTLNDRLPAGAHRLCTVFDYVAMRLTGRAEPLVHISGAASMGLCNFGGTDAGWMTDAIARAGMDPDYLPQVAAGCCLAGETPDGIPVSLGIGDNQASFIGAVRDMRRGVLVNIGTGGQVSLAGRLAKPVPDLETRPIVDDTCLVAGSSLCAGRAYALLEGFIRDVARLSGQDCGELYPAMNAAAARAMDFADPWTFDTRFSGTRRQPELRGAITGIGVDNFDADHLVGALVNGVADELFRLYQDMPRHEGGIELIGSGNGIRKNPALRLAFERRFGAPMRVPALAEEAACGAAIYAMAAAGLRGSLAQAQRVIRYQDEVDAG